VEYPVGLQRKTFQHGRLAHFPPAEGATRQCHDIEADRNIGLPAEGVERLRRFQGFRGVRQLKWRIIPCTPGTQRIAEAVELRRVQRTRAVGQLQTRLQPLMRALGIAAQHPPAAGRRILAVKPGRLAEHRDRLLQFTQRSLTRCLPAFDGSNTFNHAIGTVRQQLGTGRRDGRRNRSGFAANARLDPGRRRSGVTATLEQHILVLPCEGLLEPAPQLALLPGVVGIDRGDHHGTEYCQRDLQVAHRGA